VNHRPVFGLGKDNFEKTFDVLTTLNPDSNSNSIDTESLLYALQNYGECMNLDEMYQCFESLLGETYQANDCNHVEHRTDLNEKMKILLSRLPANLTPKRFAEDLLGFIDYQKEKQI
jgi:hypothetical protein